MNEVPCHVASLCEVQPNGLIMTKTQRGRLKKLKKRAAGCNNFITNDDSAQVGKKRKIGTASSNSFSGLTSWDDVMELEDLLQLEGKERKCEPESYGPSVHLRNPKEGQQATGSDHRDLMLSLLFHNGRRQEQGECQPEKMKTTKKFRESGTHKEDVHIPKPTKNNGHVWPTNWLPPIPSFAWIHNPACASHLAVIEFSIDFAVESVSREEDGIVEKMDPTKTWLMHFLESNSAYKELTSGLCGRQALSMHTKLFEGDNPVRASVILGHMDHGRLIQKREGDKPMCDSSKEKEPLELHKQLEAFLLSPQQMVSEEYPCCKLLYFSMDSSKYGTIISDLQKLSDSLHHLVDSRTTVLSDNIPIIKSSNALPFDSELAKKITSAIGETYNAKQLSPLISFELNYVFTLLTRHSIPHIYAIDCEMVKTTYGSEIARVTLIRLNQRKTDISESCHYTTILDMLVKPPNPIVDFVTEYSGITADLLDGVSTSLEEIQVALLGFICKEDIVVGHSLENDLHALRLSHPRVIDTAVLFRTDGRKHALRHLSQVLLKRVIQKNSNTTGGGRRGHCSIEDAAASLELAVRRAKNGSGFKLHSKTSGHIHLMELIDLARKHDDLGCTVTKEKGPLVCVGSSQWIQKCVSTRCSAHALICEDISCSSRDSICAWIGRDRRKPNFLLASLNVKSIEQLALIEELMVRLLLCCDTDT